MYRMPSLLAHALKQEICLPVARLLVLVRTTPQLFELPTGRGLYDGPSASTSGSPVRWARALACLERTSFAISLTV